MKYEPISFLHSFSLNNFMLHVCASLLPEWLSSVVGSRPFSGGVMSSQIKLLMFSSPR